MDKKQVLKKHYIIKKLNESGFFDYLINKEVQWGYSWKYQTDKYLDNIKHYEEFLYEDANFDSHWIFLFIKLKLKDLYQGCVIYGHTVDATKQRFQRILKQCIFLANRIYEDDYSDDYNNKDFRSRYIKDDGFYYFSKKKNNDIKYLFDLMNKHIQGWWD